MLLFQEAVQPANDLRYLIETYRTGSFIPKVTVYSNYYNRVDDQTFGVDLEARASSDRKRVPSIVTTILTYLDNHYPDLEDDEAMRGVWLRRRAACPDPQAALPGEQWEAGDPRGL